MRKGCIECRKYLPLKVYNYAITNFGVPFCYEHQDWFRKTRATVHAKKLYLALRQRNVPAVLEMHDGHKTVDIAVPRSNVYIEVDGAQHSSNPRQALTDLKRTYFSFLEGYLTLRIPNSLLKKEFSKTVNCIIDFLKANNERRLKTG